MIAKGLLERMEIVEGARDAFHRRDAGAIGLDRQHETAPNRSLLHQDRAGPAHAVLASEVRAGQPQLVAQEIGQGQTHIGIPPVFRAIDDDRDRAPPAHRRRPGRPACDRMAACRKARNASVAARCCRYWDGACMSLMVSISLQASAAF